MVEQGNRAMRGGGAAPPQVMPTGIAEKIAQVKEMEGSFGALEDEALDLCHRQGLILAELHEYCVREHIVWGTFLVAHFPRISTEIAQRRIRVALHWKTDILPARKAARKANKSLTYTEALALIAPRKVPGPKKAKAEQEEEQEQEEQEEQAGEPTPAQLVEEQAEVEGFAKRLLKAHKLKGKPKDLVAALKEALQEAGADIAALGRKLWKKTHPTAQQPAQE